MPTIGAAVSVETKDRFAVAASARGTTASRLAARLIADFLDMELGRVDARESLVLSQAERAVASDATRTKQVFVRLEPNYYEELGRLSAAKDWYPGTYLANLFHAHADRRPVLCDVEINAVRQVARQLADMGRNINQIAKKLNMSADHAYLVAAADVELIRMLLELEAAAIKGLIKANLHGWGVSDDET